VLRTFTRLAEGQRKRSIAMALNNDKVPSPWVHMGTHDETVSGLDAVGGVRDAA